MHFCIVLAAVFCIVFVHCTATNLALWLQETNKVYLPKVKGKIYVLNKKLTAASYEH